jgi:fibronectin type 3 domain-containing protein
MCSCSGKYVACILQSGEVNIYRSCQLLEAQSQKEPVVTERVHASEQHDVKPEKKMTTHYRIRRASKRNLLKVQKQVCIFLPSVTLLNL